MKDSETEQLSEKIMMKEKRRKFEKKGENMDFGEIMNVRDKFKVLTW